MPPTAVRGAAYSTHKREGRGELKNESAGLEWQLLHQNGSALVPLTQEAKKVCECACVYVSVYESESKREGYIQSKRERKRQRESERERERERGEEEEACSGIHVFKYVWYQNFMMVPYF